MKHSIVETIKTIWGNSLQSLEKELNLGNGTIARWDKNAPSIDKLTLVAEKLNVSVNYLLGEEENPTTLYDRIIDLCKKNNTNKTNLEKALGFSQNSINKWKTSMPSTTKVKQVADFFSVTPAYLMGLETNGSYAQKKETAKSLISDLTPEEVKKLLEYKDFLISQRNKK